MRLRLPLAILALLAVPALAQVAPVENPEDDGGRIVGGYAAPAGSVPWQAQLYKTSAFTDEQLKADGGFLGRQSAEERGHKCGGAYIGDGWILTAAHCVDGIENVMQSRAIRLGTQDLRRGGQTFAIERLIIHKDYHHDTSVHDIALVRVARSHAGQPPDPARVKPIRLIGSLPGDRALADNDRLLVTGWGLTKARSRDAKRFALDGTELKKSLVLLEVPLFALPRAACVAIPRYRASIDKGAICAGSNVPGKDSCNGDSGGPLVGIQQVGERRERVLVGLVSFGIGCALPGIPAIYTRVSEYLGWIETAKRAPAGTVSRL